MVTRKRWIWMILTGLCFFKYLPLGFEYDPILDDYIQYWGYLQVPNAWSDVVLRLGLLASRPMAGLADVYVWGRLWQFGFLVPAIITCLHIGSALLLTRALKQAGIAEGELFAVVFLLCPMGFEAKYWLSAASRLVVGVFFTGLAAYTLTCWLTSNKRGLCPVFICLALLSFLFYEQVAVLAVGVYILILLRQKKSGVLWQAWLCLGLCMGAVCFYYLLFARAGAFVSRSGLLQPSMLPDRILALAKEFTVLLYKGLIELPFNGLIRGTELLFAKPLWFVMVTGLCLSFALLYESNEKKRVGKAASVFWGIVLFILPFAPFVILAEGGLPLRSAFPSLIGLGILMQVLFQPEKRILPIWRMGVFVVLFAMMAANISEMQDYKQVSRYDKTICSGIAAQLDQAAAEGKRDVVVYGTKWYPARQNTNYKEHIYSVCQSDWALTGATRYYAKNIKIRKVIPDYLATDEILSKNPLMLSVDENLKVRRK